MSREISKDEKDVFENEYSGLKEKLKKIYNHELFGRENVKNGNLIKKSAIDSMKSSIETIKNIVDREFNDYLSSWIVNIISTRLRLIESEFNTFDSALEANIKDPEIHSIGYGENSLTFEEYFEKMIMQVDQLRYSVDYLVKLNTSLKNDANKVLLLSNNELVENLEKTKASLIKEVEDFRKSRAISANAKTEDFYDKAVTKYKLLEDKYRDYFYKSIVIVASTAFLLFLLKSCIQNIWGIGEIEFWFLKISVVTVGITLITYFIKQSAHYQRLADQNYQTQVELQAYPSFMESIPTEEAASVRKELALKYFGREIDGAAHKDMSNLISDQMKSTTEMVKAATDVLKVKDKA